MSTAFPPVTIPTIWRLAWPIILSNISIPLLGLVATGAIGHLPDSRYMGAVTLGVSLFNFLFWGFGFLRMGTTGMTSQAHGRRDDDGMRLLLAQSLILSGVIGLMLLLTSPWTIPFGIRCLGGSPDVTALAEEYAFIRIWAAPAALANYTLLGWLLGRQQARAAMTITIINSVINVLLVLLFTQCFDGRSAGAAWATLAADYGATLVSVVLVRRQLRTLGGHLPIAPLKQLSAYADLFRVNHHLFVRTLCLLFTLLFFTSRGAEAGTTILSANGVLLEFVMLLSFAMEGFAQAAETLTGEAVGARRWRRVGEIVRTCSLLAIITATSATLLFWFGGVGMIDLLTDLPGVRDAARQYLPWLVGLPLIAVWCFMFDGIFIGATDTRSMRDTIVLTTLIAGVLWYLTRGFGNHGLWFTYVSFMALRSGSLFWVYRRKRQHAWRDAQPA